MMFHLAEQLELTHCYKCDTLIESARDMSLDHREPWRKVSAELFWDLDNLAFTHKWCNKVDRPARKTGPEGQSWCSKCKTFKDVDQFSKAESRWNKLNHLCRECDNEKARLFAERNPRLSCPDCKHEMRKKCTQCGFEIPMKEYMAMRRREGAKY